MVPEELLLYLKEKKPKVSGLEKSVDLLYLFLIIYQFILIYLNYRDLPEIIPTHYNLQGEPDGYGGKGILFIFPVISVFLFFIFSLAKRFPQFLNVPWQLTKENLLRQIDHVQKFLMILKGILLLMLTLFCVQSIEIAKGTEQNLGLLLPFHFLALMALIAWYFIRGYRLR